MTYTHAQLRKVGFMRKIGSAPCPASAPSPIAMTSLPPRTTPHKTVYPTSRHPTAHRSDIHQFHSPAVWCRTVPHNFFDLFQEIVHTFRPWLPKVWRCGGAVMTRNNADGGMSVACRFPTAVQVYCVMKKQCKANEGARSRATVPGRVCTWRVVGGLWRVVEGGGGR